MIYVNLKGGKLINERQSDTEEEGRQPRSDVG